MGFRRRFVDVLLVGGGILGTVLAARMNELGPDLRVLGLRLTDSPAPNAESLRNQGMFQSGIKFLQYPVLAGEMLNRRSRLLEFLGMQSRQLSGVMQVPTIKAEKFWKRISKSIFERTVKELSDDQARALIGPFWKEDSFCVSIPDNHLDVATAMLAAREIARAKKIEFREIERLEILGRAAPGLPIRVKVDEHIVEAGLIVFTAGCGNIPYMNQLDPGHNYKIQQTPLIVIRGGPPVLAPVVFDNTNHVTISSRQPCDRIRSGCMVIGTQGSRRLIDPFCTAPQRDVCDKEKEELVDRLSPLIPIIDGKHSFTAGWEPLPLYKGRHVIPAVRGFPPGHEHRGILFAFCGRATVAMQAVDLILQELALLTKEGRILKSAQFPTFADLGTPWTAPIWMHYEDPYAMWNDYGRNKE